jgi:hypothetical protein
VRVRPAGRGAVALLVLAAGILLPAGTAQAASSGWTLSRARVGAGVASRGSVALSCASAGFCVQIGGGDTKSGLLAVVYDGRSTSTSALPVPIDAQPRAGFGVEALDCVTRSLCVAVGSYRTWTGRERPLVETYAGGGWRAMALPGIADRLEGVACNVTQCLATGLDFRSDGFDHGYVAVRDSSGNWTSPPLLDSTYGYHAENPTCPPSGACTAEVAIQSGPSPELLLEPTPDGYVSTEFPAPADAVSYTIRVGALSCPTAARCLGLGTYEDTAGLVHLAAESLVDGRLTATEIAMPSGLAGPDIFAEPTDASCAVAGGQLLCSAAANLASFTGPGQHAMLADYRNGSWTARLARPPAATGGAQVRLDETSCSSGGHCAAVGSYTANGRVLPFVSDLGALSWQTTDLALPPGLSAADDVQLTSVSCDGSRCLAGGNVRYRPDNPELHQLLVARYR